MGKQSRLVQYNTDYLRHFIGLKKLIICRKTNDKTFMALGFKWGPKLPVLVYQNSSCQKQILWSMKKKITCRLIFLSAMKDKIVKVTISKIW